MLAPANRELLEASSERERARAAHEIGDGIISMSGYGNSDSSDDDSRLLDEAATDAEQPQAARQQPLPVFQEGTAYLYDCMEQLGKPAAQMEE